MECLQLNKNTGTTSQPVISNFNCCKCYEAVETSKDKRGHLSEEAEINRLRRRCMEPKYLCFLKFESQKQTETIILNSE